MAEEATRSSSASYSGPNPCPICLDPVTQDSYLDRCFHKFCYDCIVRWATLPRKHSVSPVSLNCPLCKVENFSIVYGYDGNSFQQHYIGNSLGKSEFFSGAHRYRLKCYYTEPGSLDSIVHVPRYWKSRKYLQQNIWLQDWLRREIQAVMQEEDVDMIVHHVVGVIDSLGRGSLKDSRKAESVQEEFRVLVSNAVKPFITGRAERFVYELELFLASGLNINAFDEVYTKHLGWKFQETSPEDGDETLERRPVAPYLYIFDEDSDEN